MASKIVWPASNALPVSCDGPFSVPFLAKSIAEFLVVIRVFSKAGGLTEGGDGPFQGSLFLEGFCQFEHLAAARFEANGLTEGGDGFIQMPRLKNPGEVADLVIS